MDKTYPRRLWAAPHGAAYPLRNPLDYYRRHDRPSLTVGTGVVLAQSLAFVIGIYLFVDRVLARIDFPPGARAAATSGVFEQLFYYFVMSIIGWVLLAVVLHVFVWFADGRRGFPTTLAIVGEAELVGIVLLPVALFVLLTTAGDVPQDPQAALSFLQDSAPHRSPLTLLSSFVGTIWKVVITGYGLSVAHDMDRGKAFLLTFAIGLLAYVFTLGA